MCSITQSNRSFPNPLRVGPGVRYFGQRGVRETLDRNRTIGALKRESRNQCTLPGQRCGKLARDGRGWRRVVTTHRRRVDPPKASRGLARSVARLRSEGIRVGGKIKSRSIENIREFSSN